MVIELIIGLLYTFAVLSTGYMVGRKREYRRWVQSQKDLIESASMHGRMPNFDASGMPWSGNPAEAQQQNVYPAGIAGLQQQVSNCCSACGCSSEFHHKKTGCHCICHD